MNPTIPPCEICGHIGTYHDKEGSRCNNHRMYYPNKAQEEQGYVAGFGEIKKLKEPDMTNEDWVHYYESREYRRIEQIKINKVKVNENLPQS